MVVKKNVSQLLLFLVIILLNPFFPFTVNLGYPPNFTVLKLFQYIFHLPNFFILCLINVYIQVFQNYIPMKLMCKNHLRQCRAINEKLTKLQVTNLEVNKEEERRKCVIIMDTHKIAQPKKYICMVSLFSMKCILSLC